MPKNKGKGGKNVRRGKNMKETVSKTVEFKEGGQDYARVLRLLGNSRVECESFDGKKRTCKICGKMRKKVWINQGDIVLLGLRDFEDDKADVIHKFSADDTRYLKQMKEIPDSVTVEENNEIEFVAMENNISLTKDNSLSDISDDEESSDEEIITKRGAMTTLNKEGSDEDSIEEETTYSKTIMAASKQVKFDKKNRGNKRVDQSYIDRI